MTEAQVETPVEVDEDKLTGVGGPIELSAVHKQLLFGKDVSIGRVHPMKVLVLGMPGTETPAILAALRQLGITRVYDTKSMLDPHNSNDRKHLLRLHSKEARKNRYDFFSAADFDPVLKDYDAVIGWPGAVFATDLMIAYRNVPIILPAMSPSRIQAWRRNLKSTYTRLETSILLRIIRATKDSSFKETYDFLKVFYNYLFDGDIQRYALMSYRIQESRIKATLTLQGRSEKDSLLLFDSTSCGWEPLCTLLDAPVPRNVPFPANLPASEKALSPLRLFLLYLPSAYSTFSRSNRYARVLNFIISITFWCSIGYLSTMFGSW